MNIKYALSFVFLISVLGEKKKIGKFNKTFIDFLF